MMRSEGHADRMVSRRCAPTGPATMREIGRDGMQRSSSRTDVESGVASANLARRCRGCTRGPRGAFESWTTRVRRIKFSGSADHRGRMRAEGAPWMSTKSVTPSLGIRIEQHIDDAPVEVALERLDADKPVIRAARSAPSSRRALLLTTVRVSLPGGLARAAFAKPSRDGLEHRAREPLVPPALFAKRAASIRLPKVASSRRSGSAICVGTRRTARTTRCLHPSRGHPGALPTSATDSVSIPAPARVQRRGPRSSCGRP